MSRLGGLLGEEGALLGGPRLLPREGRLEVGDHDLDRGERLGPRDVGAEAAVQPRRRVVARDRGEEAAELPLDEVRDEVPPAEVAARAVQVLVDRDEDVRFVGPVAGGDEGLDRLVFDDVGPRGPGRVADAPQFDADRRSDQRRVLDDDGAHRRREPSRAVGRRRRRVVVAVLLMRVAVGTGCHCRWCRGLADRDHHLAREREAELGARGPRERRRRALPRRLEPHVAADRRGEPLARHEAEPDAARVSRVDLFAEEPIGDPTRNALPRVAHAEDQALLRRRVVSSVVLPGGGARGRRRVGAAVVVHQHRTTYPVLLRRRQRPSIVVGIA
mmetsp:Transcript_24357/g.96584  ORF Transcript_24357/g.96584 Transcript_24357/m.96584 type:complete len:330 (+) Transcript_24357:210-1199(+)